MFQGFYNLTSGMLTQNRRLNVISNNMANVNTTGFKGDQVAIKTFEEEMVYRTGAETNAQGGAIGTMYKATGIDREYTDFEQGGIQQTTRNLDIALMSQGFFTVQVDGQELYTRNGSFSLDDEGFLAINGMGRVMGQNGEIQLGTEDITVDTMGNIYTREDNQLVDRLAIVDFENYDEDLTKADNGTFKASGEAIAYDAVVMQKTLETSNVDAIEQMTEMMAASKALQSSAQILTMYDQLMSKIVTQIGNP